MCTLQLNDGWSALRAGSGGAVSAFLAFCDASVIAGVPDHGQLEFYPLTRVS